MSAPELSVVIPAYNEARILEASLAQLIAFLEDLGKSFEVLAVDDGSTDESAQILREGAQRDPRLIHLGLPENQGKGAAVRKGMLAARGGLSLFLDADLSTPLQEIPALLGALESGYEVVIGNRRAPGSEVTRHQPWIRESLGRGFTTLTRWMLAPGVHDFTCGFKGFSQRAAREIFQRTTLSGWAFDAELVVIAQELGFRLAQVPVSWHDEEGSKVRVASAVVQSLRELLHIRWNRMRGRYR